MFTNAGDWENQLRGEGFKCIYTWEESSLVHYPDHTHDALSAHIILGREMAVIVEGKAHACKVGERFDVNPNTVHSAPIGPKGRRYLIGEKWKCGADLQVSGLSSVSVKDRRACSARKARGQTSASVGFRKR